MFNLISAMAVLDGNDIRPVIFSGDDIPESDLLSFRNLKDATVIVDSLFRRDRLLNRQVRAILLGRDSRIEALYREKNIDGVFENAFFHGTNSQYRALAWMPDFQHRHLKHLFSARRYWKRELGFRMQLRYRDDILLSSKDATNDLRRFYPGSIAKIHVLRFCAALPDAILDEPIDSVREKYQLPASFVFVPNHFYFHKNHEVIVRALSIVRKAGTELSVVTSGNISSASASNSAQSIRKLVSKLGLDPHFQLLGSVPYMDVLRLMLASSATLNPSFFEGWSTTVEEAKALNVPLILSDIGVHREQAEGRAVFFDASDPSDLADKISACIRNESSHAGREAIEKLLAQNRIDRRKVALRFSNILSSCFA